jgi:Domain of unknown function (DUF3883)
MIHLSPGVAQSCFELLGLVSRRLLPFAEIAASFARIGVCRTSIVIECAQRLNWLRADGDGIAVLTPSGARLLGFATYQPMLRQALLDYIDAVNPPWVQNAAFGRKRCLAYAGADIAQMFLEAGLTSGTSVDVLAFWDGLAARARGLMNQKLTEVGRQGERLTIATEQYRTGRSPKWVSVDSNQEGYDVLSVVAAENPARLLIEVKASTLSVESAVFHLTRNEWERAVSAPDHCFHLWDMSRDPPQICVLTTTTLEPHIPKDQCLGEWNSAQVPFRAFAAIFRPLESEVLSTAA